ncbi:FAD/NAD(P)-binding domain-containing protein [Piedraia hortae CBS 480.64]|uniref:Rab proteins geranylgeranyltransferase n=1 Tax=Piedraia hortae CBS 480.64 TaxID=1314780 RepID=A0A6A7BSZ9_9PEZI|nr:FAD/NAD(P)-binding domain-containing protein [Piedraia hortae CBS 480.64]
MDTLQDTDWDLVISGTGVPQSLLALALSRRGLRILHLDRNPYYGQNEAALTLNEAQEWAQRHTCDNFSPFTQASVSTPATDGKLGSSRAYALALAPQFVYSWSQLVPALISSQTHNHLEFQAVGSWFTLPKSGSSLLHVPNGREDIFQDESLNLRTKRSLVKFLRYVADYEGQGDWSEKKGRSFVEELSESFGLSDVSYSPLLALALSSEPAHDTTFGSIIPKIACHIRSMGAFGAGFAAVMPKWGGLAELAQVACRACAVGGGVYVLNRGIESATQLSTGQLSLELAGGDRVTTKWLVGSSADMPQELQPQGETISTADYAKSICIVSSPLPTLFPPTSDGVVPAGAVVYVETERAPVRILAHSGEAGECPSTQCVLYASTLAEDGFEVLEQAVQWLLASLNEQAEVLWKVQYRHCGATLAAPTFGDGVCLLPTVSPDVTFDDKVLDQVKAAWLRVSGEDEEMFMQLEARQDNVAEG